MTNILFCIYSFNLGGTEKALLSLLQALAKRQDVHVTVLSVKDEGSLKESFRRYATLMYDERISRLFDTEIIYPLQSIKDNIAKGRWGYALRQVYGYAKTKMTQNWGYWYMQAVRSLTTLPGNFDLAVAYAGPHDFISCYTLDRVSAARYYQWIHFDVKKVLQNNLFGTRYYPRFDKIYAVSDNAAKHFVQMFPALKTQTEVFKNIVSRQDLVSMAAIGNSYTDQFAGYHILTVGRLSEEKGQQMIPAVAQRLKEAGISFRWYVLGEGYMAEPLQQQISSLGLTDDVVLLGADANPYAYMRDCDLYVQTSLHEGYCITIHEAKMFDRPVVTTNVASAANLIVHEEDGLIVPISEEGLYQGIVRVLTHPELLRDYTKSMLATDTTSEADKLLPHHSD
ncbi:4-alpha-N-acetylgalactosaminyltransferase [compost metagenome]